MKSQPKIILLFALIFNLSATAHVHVEDDILDQINTLLESTNQDFLEESTVPIVKTKTPKLQKRKEWTLILYISADNDLRNFAVRNIKQMARIGSSKHINIVVHLDIKLSGNRKVTRRYYIEKNKILHVNAEDKESQRMDSGNPETLVSCCKWGITNFPAKHYGLILWDHGTGALDPRKGRVVKLTDLFTFNPEINKVELDRSIGFFDFINAKQEETRGICWDDTTGNYLTNHDLEYAFSKICSTYLNNKKFDFIGFDACLMQMIEVANIAKKYADIMIGSQEVILGTGWNYIETLKPFLTATMTAQEFAKHIVLTYQKTYSKITNDYTLSAIKLKSLAEIEANIDKVAKTLIYCLKNQRNRSVKKAIASSRNKLVCTHFDEPSFIDLHHFYKNLIACSKYIQLNNPQENQKYKNLLINLLNKGCKTIENMMIENVAGKNLRKAKGLSIYFPTRRIYFSYRKLNFSLNHDWILFLTQYLNL